MSDIFSRQHRSWIMSRIRSRDTKPEKAVRSTVHRLGFRFRLHRSDYPGRPDLILPRWRVAIFVHGCFWHHHAGCKRATVPAVREDFWRKKLATNQARDRAAISRLKKLGWRTVVIWECETRLPSRLLSKLRRSLLALKSRKDRRSKKKMRTR